MSLGCWSSLEACLTFCALLSTWDLEGWWQLWSLGKFYGCTLSEGRANVTSQHLEEVTAGTCLGTGRQGISMWEYSIFWLHWVKQDLGSVH